MISFVSKLCFRYALIVVATFPLQEFKGNNDSDSVRRHHFKSAVITRKIRLYPIGEEFTIYCLRMELYGCAWEHAKGECNYIFFTTGNAIYFEYFASRVQVGEEQDKHYPYRLFYSLLRLTRSNKTTYHRNHGGIRIQHALFEQRNRSY